MGLNPYLNFNGQCEEAFKFYEKVLGGKIVFMMTWGEGPPEYQTSEETRKLIMHATMSVDGSTLMGADSPPDRYEKPQGISLSLHYNDEAQGKQVFEALGEGGTVLMPFQKTFWAAGFGMCVDRFGIPWMVNCEQPAQKA